MNKAIKEYVVYKDNPSDGNGEILEGCYYAKMVNGIREWVHGRNNGTLMTQKEARHLSDFWACGYCLAN